MALAARAQSALSGRQGVASVLAGKLPCGGSLAPGWKADEKVWWKGWGRYCECAAALFAMVGRVRKKIRPAFFGYLPEKAGRLRVAPGVAACWQDSKKASAGLFDHGRPCSLFVWQPCAFRLTVMTPVCQDAT